MRFLFVLLALSMYAEDRHIEHYLKFLSEHQEVLGKKGSFRDHEIEIVTEPSKIKAIEKLQKARSLKQGMTEEAATAASKVGVIAEDSYWVLMRDAVIFPTGAEGTYNRLLLKRALDKGFPAVVVLPILPDGKIATIVSFRHATRSWELEIPGGFKQGSETVEETLKRELQEEAGYQAKETFLLGTMAPDPSVAGSTIPVYAARVGRDGLSNQDYSEAIFGVKTFTFQELKEALVKGFIEIDMWGRKEKVYVRNSYLVYALFLADCRKIIAPEKGAG